MRRRLQVGCLVLLLCVAAVAKKKDKKPAVDQRLLSAQYVCIVSASGDDLDPRTQNGDRSAILRVEDAIKAWGRYHVVYNPDDADILLEVRTGRRAGVGMGGPIGTGPVPIPGVPGPSGGGVRIGRPDVVGGGETDVSNVNEDMISIYDARVGLDHMKSTSVLWRGAMAHGLGSGANEHVPLVDELKKEVEAATATPAKSKP
jgi:hypothetical protein